MIYYDVLTGICFKESEVLEKSEVLVAKLFKEFYIDEVKMAKDTWECEFTKTAKIVSIEHYYNWLLDNIPANQSFRETAAIVVDLFSDHKIQLDMTTELSEQSEIVIVLRCRSII